MLLQHSRLFSLPQIQDRYILRKYVASVCSHSMSFQIDIKQPIKWINSILFIYNKHWEKILIQFTMKALNYSILYKCTVHSNKTQTSKIKHQHVVLNVSIKAAFLVRIIEEKNRKLEPLIITLLSTILIHVLNYTNSSITWSVVSQTTFTITRIEMFGFISTSKYMYLLHKSHY